MNSDFRMTEYPKSTQVEAVKLVDAALSVAAWQDIFSSDALECAANYLDRQVASCRTDSANGALEAIAKHYREESRDTASLCLEQNDSGESPPVGG